MDILIPNNSKLFTTSPIFLPAKAMFSFKLLKSLIIGVILLVMGIVTVSASNRFSVRSGNWNSTSTWSSTSGGSNGYSVPVAGDVVVIEGNDNVTVNVNSACTNVTIASGSSLNVGGYNFTVSGTTTINGTISFITSTSGTKSMGNVVIGGGTWTSNVGEAYAISNLTLSGSTINGSSTGSFNVSSNLNVTSGTANNLNAFNITVTGTSTINGTISFLSTTGTKTFTGLTTIGSSGTWDNDNVNESVTFRGGVTNNGTFFAGNSIYTFDTNQALNGTLIIPNVTVSSGITLTNNGALTVSTALSGAGGLTNTGTGILNITGTSGITTLTASSNGNSVNYNGAAQTVKPTTYSNLTLSGSGAKTIGTGTSVTGNLSISGATASINTGVTVNIGNLTLGGLNTDNGTWGSSSSSATFKNDMYFSATTGMVISGSDTRSLTATISGLTTSQSICFGTATVTLSGTISASGPVYPANGETVNVTINSNTLPATFSGGTGAFSINFPSSGIPSSGTPYTITYSYPGNGFLKAPSNNTSTSLTVNPATLINSQSTGTQTRCIGNAFTAITVTATGTGTLSYQWFSNTTASTSGGTSLGTTNGAQTSSYTPQSTVTGTLYYYCIATGTCFTATSAVSGAFIVNPTTSIASQSTATQTQCAGASFSPITVTAAGVGLTYQWYSNTTASTSGGASLGATNGAATNSYTPQTTTVGTLYYYCVVTGTCSSATSAVSGAFIVNASPSTPTTTGANLCIGTNSAVTLSASGAASGEKYKWYDAASGGNLLKTSNDNVDNTYTTGNLGATTNFWVSILNAGGCESSRAQVTATYPALSADDQSAAGTDSWIGHVYEGTNQGVTYIGSFANYYGHYTESTESFDQGFGGDATCFGITSNSIGRSIYTETFAVRYRMNSTKKGLYAVNVGSDDGGRLSIDNNLVYNDWTDHAVSDHQNVLINLTGSSALVYDFYENGGGNRVYFKSLTQILANILSGNTTQSIFVGNTGAAISGDVYGTLPGGITTNGTGYQWSYSTTLGGARTSITGATGATYSPNAATAPFNVPGTYYIFRNAVLSSSNNVSPNPYIATYESNAAMLTVVAMPVITTSATTLSGFSYPVGYGPSTQLKSFTVSGANLTGNITVLPTDSFEISLNSGASFDPQTLITLSVNNGSVASTTIYVRMKAGLALGSIAVSNIKCITDNGVTKTVGCSGTVAAAPVVNITPATLNGFTYMYTNGPSTQNLFTVSGTNLLGNVIVTPPADFEISTTSNGTFQSTPITITASGTLNSTIIYVRMKTGVGVGTITENVIVSSLNATSINVSCSGTVTPAPTILNSISTLSTFIYTLNSGPSGEQSFTVIGTNLSDNITVTPPTNYEISKTSVNGFQSTAFSLVQSGGTLNATIYVRLKSALPATDYNLASILLTSTGATTKSVSCNGSVVSTATILTSKSSITGFGYQASAGGPSSEQMFTVSGSSLASNMSVAPPSNYYEISLTSGSGYQTTPITLTLTSTRVNPTIIYVRLKKGLAAGDYTGTITASVGTLKKDVTLIGKVFASPLIAIGGGGFYCLGSTINLTSTGADIQNRYWEGPNSFYSVLQNPQLTTNATVALSGTYKVTGNVTVGGNLITNGDFEAGNTSFGSNYKYVDPTGNALYNEGLYTIINIPHVVHSDFTTNGDHTSTTGMQMVINGSPTAGVVVWSQSVPVISGASYQFTYWLQSVTSTNPSQLQLYVNGVAAGPVNIASTTVPLWTQFLYNALAGSNTVLNLELINQNTGTGGNDFAIDDIVFQQILSATASTDITVAASVPVSVSVAASANPVIQGVTVTYTATPVNGGTTPLYAWYVNNVIVPGITGGTYSYVPSNNDKISCVLTSSISCVTNNPASSNTVTMTVNIGTNYWIGTTSTDWATTSNWTGVKVPLAGDNVVYATATNNSGKPAVRDLYVDGDRTIGSLINATNKRLVIPANKSLTVNNTITTNGSDSLIYIVSSSTIANGSLIFHNASDAPVHATVEMYSKAFYDEAGPTNQKYHWQYFGIPVSQITASPTFDNSYVRIWDEKGDAITNHWLSLTNSSVLTPFTGYEITQKVATTIVFQGQLVNSDFDSGQLSVTPTALFPGQHVYANPYTAAIDIRQLTFGLQTEATVYLYNTGTFDQWTQASGANAPGTGAGQYVAIPKNTAGSSGLPRQIPSMQAILVKAMTNSSDATFGITYNTVVMNNTDPQRSPGINYQPGTDNVSTMIDVKGASYSDKMWLFTQPGCTPNFDNGWDGAKMPGIALTPQIFAVGNDGNYQVNAVDDINNTLLGFQAGQDVEYKMTFTHQNLKSKYEAVFLVDLVENKAVDITESGSTYSFVAESTPTSVNRFKIATRNIEKDASDKNTLLKVFSSGNTVFVQNLGSLNGEMNIYDMMGRYIRRANFGPYGVTAVQVGSIQGAYVVNASTTGERVSKRIILGK